MWYLRRFGLTGVCAACCLLLPAAWGEAAFTITQITSNSYDDFHPQVSGQHVVWKGEVSVGNDEVFHYNLGSSTLTPISSDSAFNDWNPMVSGTNVVWEKQDPTHASATQVYHWNETSGLSTNLTLGSTADNYNPQIDGQLVTWDNRGANWEIVLHDLNTASQRAIARVGTDSMPAVSGTNVVWQGLVGGANEEIFYFNAAANPPPWMGPPLVATFQITNDPRGTPPVVWVDALPRVSGNIAVWVATDNVQSDVFACDLTSPLSTITNISNSPWNDSAAQVDGSIVVWASWDSTDQDSEIFYCDLSEATPTSVQITNNGNPQSDFGPQVSGRYIVWTGDTTPEGNSSDPDNYEIFLYDTDTGVTSQITDNDVQDWMPQIDGLQVVWSGVGEGGDFEIFATVVPEPTTAVLLAIAGSLLAGYALRRRLA